MADPENAVGQSIPNWDISVACDIRLGDYFNNSPSGRGKFIDINPVSIQYVLEEFEPNLSGRLLFIAQCGDTMPVNDGDLACGGVTTNEGVQTAYVCVGGRKSDSLSKDTFTKLLNEVALQRAVETEHGLRPCDEVNEEEANQEKQLAADQLLTELSTVLDESIIQETAVHELSHVAYFIDSAKSNEHKRFVKRVGVKAGILVTGSMISVGVVSNLLSREILGVDNPTLPISLGGAMGWLVGVLYLSRVKDHIKRQIYFQSPTEKKAYATSEHAQYMPSIIIIRNQPPQTETLF